MLPRLSIQDGIDGIPNDSVALADVDGRLGWKPSPNITNLFGCQFFGLTNKTALSGTRINKPAFSQRIPHIVGMSAHKKVPDVCATWLIALVANFHSYWNRSKFFFPHGPMRRLRDASIKAYQSIPPFCLGAFPKPTLIWSSAFNFLPKSFRKWFKFKKRLNRSRPFSGFGIEQWHSPCMTQRI